MYFNRYQAEARNTAVYREKLSDDMRLTYTALGLAGEAGEVAEKVKKHFRDGGDKAATREQIKKELGDVLWYVAMTAYEWDLYLDDVAEANVAKLADRRERGVLHGSGDNR